MDAPGRETDGASVTCRVDTRSDRDPRRLTQEDRHYRDLARRRHTAGDAIRPEQRGADTACDRSRRTDSPEWLSQRVWREDRLAGDTRGADDLVK